MVARTHAGAGYLSGNVTNTVGRKPIGTFRIDADFRFILTCHNETHNFHKVRYGITML